MRRRGRWIVVCIAGVVAAVLSAVAAVAAADAPSAVAPAPAASAGAAAPAKEAAGPQPPVQISADAAEYFNKEGLVVFTGNVVAVQADATITADRMEVVFAQPEPAGGKPAEGIGAPANAQRITQITADKNVSFRQVDPETKKERYATGERGVYDVGQRVVTLSGKPRLWEGKNVIAGDELLFYLADKKVIVRGKVNLTVYPDEMKEGKQP